MTEEQKKLRERFLEPETRCGHYVSAETKVCWKVMLDMLEEVDRICRKHDIRYFLIAGSLLGAIRHKGFIPWDDDVDIALFREDYDKLEKILPGELPPNMFMQTILTDPEYRTEHMKIRMAGTAAIQEHAVTHRLRYNMGIFIDVFPLEGVPRTHLGMRIAQKIGARWLDFLKYSRTRAKLHSRRERIKKFLYVTLWRFLGNRLTYRLLNWSIGKYGLRDDGECIQSPCDMGYSHKYRYKVGLLRETTDVPFEYLTLKAPKEFDAVLSSTYGDWHKIVKGGAAHSIVAMSPTVDYKMILVEKFGYMSEELSGLS